MTDDDRQAAMRRHPSSLPANDIDDIVSKLAWLYAGPRYVITNYPAMRVLRAYWGNTDYR